MEALLFVFGIQGTHSIFVCSCSAAELSSHLLGHVFTPQKKSPDPPRGVFGDRSLSSLCGPVGFRGVPPYHRPIHPKLFQWEESTQGAVLRHHYVVGMLRYLDDWWIIAESRTSSIRARDGLLQVCEELGLQVVAESRL